MKTLEKINKQLEVLEEYTGHLDVISNIKKSLFGLKQELISELEQEKLLEEKKKEEELQFIIKLNRKIHSDEAKKAELEIPIVCGQCPSYSPPSPHAHPMLVCRASCSKKAGLYPDPQSRPDNCPRVDEARSLKYNYPTPSEERSKAEFLLRQRESYRKNLEILKAAEKELRDDKEEFRLWKEAKRKSENK